MHYNILYIRSPIQVAQVLHATPKTLQRDDKVNELHQKCNPVSDQVVDWVLFSKVWGKKIQKMQTQTKGSFE